MDEQFYTIKGNCAFIKVKATTRASKNAVTGVFGGELLVSVTAVPENGKANSAIIKIISDHFKISKTKFTLISGAKSRKKIFSVEADSLNF